MCRRHFGLWNNVFGIFHNFLKIKWSAGKLIDKTIIRWCSEVSCSLSALSNCPTIKLFRSNQTFQLFKQNLHSRGMSYFKGERKNDTRPLSRLTLPLQRFVAVNVKRVTSAATHSREQKDLTRPWTSTAAEKSRRKRIWSLWQSLSDTLGQKPLHCRNSLWNRFMASRLKLPSAPLSSNRTLITAL